MLLLELPDVWIAILNVVSIPAIHMGISWLFIQMPLRWFSPQSVFYTEKPGEFGGRIYETLFFIRSWKNVMPDGASWFPGGFAKKKITSSDPDYIREFISETCRSEAAHVAQFFALIAVLWTWNPWPASAVIGVYAFISNFPCTIIQRHTRFRMTALLEKLTENER